jgi:hypothetical protein
MIWRVRAIFERGKFVPHDRCALPEGAEFDLHVEGPLSQPPIVTDPAERAAILKRITQRMAANPISNGSPRLTRDQFHERR